MKIKYQGIFKHEYQLPSAALPRNAVKIKEAETLDKRYQHSIFFLFIINFVLIILVVMSILSGSKISMEVNPTAAVVGFIGGLIFMFLHEPLHTFGYGVNVEDVSIYFYARQLMIFSVCTWPISKGRYVLSSFWPHIVFGWIPLSLWLFIPFNSVFSGFIFYFSLLSAYSGMIDYYNIFNALWQMPNGSVRLSSGLNSYWYVP